jgi:NAD(P)-dependent dehydrogenase (short-subunit alcohol dehydrogenase family)
MNLFDCTGKVVVATGGMSGIGRAFLSGCARQGADVAIIDHDCSDIGAFTTELLAMGAGRVFHATADVSDERAVDCAIAAVIAELGRIDCAFANAGIGGRMPSFTDTTSEAWRALMAVNLDGAFFTLRGVAAHMKARAATGDSGGSLVACGSLSIFHGIPGMQHYAAAKGALAALIKGLAVEMGPYGVRANLLVPGFILTSLTDGRPESQAVIERMSAATPLGRPGNMQDIEGPAAYLASDASRFQTGATLVIDGGRLVKNL